MQILYKYLILTYERNNNMKHLKKTLLLMLVILLAASIFSNNAAAKVLAADGSCIRVNEALLPANSTWAMTAGENASIDLSKLFTDTGNHSLTYGFSVIDSTGKDYASPQIHISDSAETTGVFTFSAPDMGNYTVTVFAICGETNERESAVIHAVVNAAGQGLPVQYGYDETSKDAVTVFVTVSSDGIPLMGNDDDSTILSHLEVTVPYFDLGLYDLQGYYRYKTGGTSGGYVGDTVIVRPTAMHLFIYMVERYYMGLPESQCGKGTSGVIDGVGDFGVTDMFGKTAYDDQDGCSLSYTGAACSTYMKEVWGHDENLMYYRNHAYPLQRPGWGSTSDYILLSDGDTIDLAMFTDWGFYQNGSFCTFVDRDTSVNDGESNDDHTDINYRPDSAFAAVVGESKTISAVRFGTQSLSAGGSDSFEPIGLNPYTAGLVIGVYDENWNEITDMTEYIREWDCDNGVCTVTFAKPGIYYLLGVDANAGRYENGTSDACIAPATAKIVVTEAEPEEPVKKGDVNGDGNITNADIRLIRNHILQKITLTAEQQTAADVNGDVNITNADVRMVRNFILQKISSLG